MNLIMTDKDYNNIRLDGTHLQGYVNVSYNQLINVFGEPNGIHDKYKIDAEWVVEFPAGIIATIYNYKDGKNYLGEEGSEVEDINEWHIGGHEYIAILFIKERLREQLGESYYVDRDDW